MPKREGQEKRSHRFTLTRQEVDFPLGPGTWLVDVEMELAWVGKEAETFAPRALKKGASSDHTVEVITSAVVEGQTSEIADAVTAERQA